MHAAVAFISNDFNSVCHAFTQMCQLNKRADAFSSYMQSFVAFRKRSQRFGYLTKNGICVFIAVEFFFLFPANVLYAITQFLREQFGM